MLSLLPLSSELVGALQSSRGDSEPVICSYYHANATSEDKAWLKMAY